ncbi:hypothetical protein BEWA_007780 [Theileria equi strain WA]|uniref:tRNA (guanine(9)-N(1))-methyltransferase n=1 Tax=Theileria equi strain WA TaxID=1537102 RepID=L0B2N2_THEEQ|nr:hypothetical protein BEWA_007780 [Theileria equi strain WA]AFZ81369.1 hypothetical protein BEWA_007780 [Theileria equi strain WA]|eukprot:XP_004831035.1 hypothetical protein BEWA_007780 [Theileria equi strain WA]
MDDEGRKTFVLNERKAKIEHQENLNSLLDHAYNEGVGVCINCSFNEIMNPREIRSLAKQLSMSYNLIKKHMAPIKMVLTSFSHDSALYKDCELFGIQNWKIHKHEQGFWEIFESEKIIVLTPDATEILEEIQHDKVYIIGGLVDTNVKKRETLTQASKYGITCKSLPVKKYFPECKKVVLNVSTVFEILMHKINNLSWEDALNRCIPVRAKR